MSKVKLFTIAVADRPGTVASAIRSLAAAGVNVLSVLGWGPAGVVEIVTDNPVRAKKALDTVGVAHQQGSAEIVELPNKPGALLTFLDGLAKKNVNLRSLCATTSKGGRKAVLVWTVNPTAPTRQI